MAEPVLGQKVSENSAGLALKVSFLKENISSKSLNVQSIFTRRIIDTDWLLAPVIHIYVRLIPNNEK